MSKIIFETSFLFSNIMCFTNCAKGIQETLVKHFEKEIKKDVFLNTRLHLSAKPQMIFGTHQINLFIESDSYEGEEFLSFDTKRALRESFKDALLAFCELEYKPKLVEIGSLERTSEENNAFEKEETYTSYTNLLINLVVLVGLSLAIVLLPSSIALTIGLTLGSFLTTAYTARKQLKIFFENLYARIFNPVDMTTTVSLGWLLSIFHSLYHSISMPLCTSLPMLFMSFVMPVALMALINGMSVLKAWMKGRVNQMSLKELKNLFPEMEEAYPTYFLTPEMDAQLSALLKAKSFAEINQIRETILRQKPEKIRYEILKKGDVFQIKKGKCAPVDCELLSESMNVDTSLVSGESTSTGGKSCGDNILAGFINLGSDVWVRVLRNSFESEINNLLCISHRKIDNDSQILANEEKKDTFFFNYSLLIGVGMLLSIALPFAFGIFSFPLMLQSLIGILFAVCPCTLALAQELPHLIKLNTLSAKKVILRHGTLPRHPVRAVIFDKTGTLTNGNFEVQLNHLPKDVLERVYLLEKQTDHPLARAIVQEYEKRQYDSGEKQRVLEQIADNGHRGFQGRIEKENSLEKEEITLHIGNAVYLREQGISVPDLQTEDSVVHVAENNEYKGYILVKSFLRPGAVECIKFLREKKEKVEVYLLTGDNAVAARALGHGLFEPENIIAGRDAFGKNLFVEALQKKFGTLQGVVMVGDGLNDAFSARTVSEFGGVSFAMSEKLSFFADATLGNSFDFLMDYFKNGVPDKKITRQNEWLMMGSTTIFMGFVILFSILGIGLPPILPLAIMSVSTLTVLFNSYRERFRVDEIWQGNNSWWKKFLASDWSLISLSSSLGLFLTSVLSTTWIAGGLSLPSLALGSGLAIFTSGCLISAGVFGAVFLIALTFWVRKEVSDSLQSGNHSKEQADCMPTSSVSKALQLLTKASGLPSPITAVAKVQESFVNTFFWSLFRKKDSCPLEESFVSEEKLSP